MGGRIHRSGAVRAINSNAADIAAARAVRVPIAPAAVLLSALSLGTKTGTGVLILCSDDDDDD
jgi:hypothetical protein